MEEKVYKIMNNQLTYGRGYVYSLQYHIVWCTKYRRQVLKNGADTDCKALLQELAEEYRFRICIPDMIKIMKGGIARRLFRLHPEMKKKLWGGHLWNPSYCVVTVSDRSREMVEQYIESQKERAWSGKGRPPKDLLRLQAYHREAVDADHVRLRGRDSETP